MKRIEFVSDEFLPRRPEAEQVNPGVYGFELAQWLREALGEQGIATSAPSREDWGWFVECVQDGQRLMVGCSSIAEPGDGYANKPILWSVFAESLWSLRRWLNRAVADEAAGRVLAVVVAALSAKGIAAEDAET